MGRVGSFPLLLDAVAKRSGPFGFANDAAFRLLRVWQSLLLSALLACLLVYYF